MVLSNNKKISSRQAPSGAFLLGGNMQIVEKELSWLKPYVNNPRDNESAVEPVAKSIKEFGFKVPIVATSDGEIINGHTRFKASKRLGLEKVPVIIADDLTDEQIKAFRLADNKVSEFSKWNEDKLRDELKQLEMDMTEFGFEFTELTELLEEEKEKEQEPEIKFTEELGEESNYIVLKFDTSVDWLIFKCSITSSGYCFKMYVIRKMARSFGLDTLLISLLNSSLRLIASFVSCSIDSFKTISCV